MNKNHFIKAILIASSILLGGLFLFILYLTTGIGLKCVIYEFFKIKCISCGITHSLIALLSGDIITAFKYNYIFPLIFCYLGYVFIYAFFNCIKTGKFSYFPKKQYLDIIVLIIFVCWFILRNLLKI